MVKNNAPDRVVELYRRLSAHYGRQDWWPGDSPFEVMVGAVLTQNTAWKNVEKAIASLKQCVALDAEALLLCDEEKLAAAIRSSGYFNLKARRLRALCHWLLAQGGIDALADRPTGELRTGLLSVHGVGPETADDILLYALDRPVFVVDTYTRRLFGRIGLIDGGESYDMIRRLVEASLRGDIPGMREYHALIVTHAKSSCMKSPRCGDCVLRSGCAYGRRAG